ncbi:hypothetical protein [Phyllobacterium sp. P30BS-XVII]|uniref:hypothetical protein n=1 Tax=Phyllobacterium sp. P30BS-XVII TaxID=2587046 RepID=UPI0015FD7EB3|nr:hypothetical protein [Phyllobacterium sp. P30BS-XVII]MBA8904212.1 hypothetical protein [Phyllobacterium sp. P30BS-XVII]
MVRFINFDFSCSKGTVSFRPASFMGLSCGDRAAAFYLPSETLRLSLFGNGSRSGPATANWFQSGLICVFIVWPYVAPFQAGSFARLPSFFFPYSWLHLFWRQRKLQKRLM